ncbi:MAG: DUF4249 family protein [Bacteroidia bacterium]|nr:DUF4249 family protein [Bacteroidia bacterium]
MQNKYSIYLLLLLALLGVLPSCSTDFEVYAPEKDIYIVYCVLNPEDSLQTVRISKAYQVEGDAIQYAGENDFSVKGLKVVLKGGGKEYTAVEVPNYPRDSDGIFIPSQTVYQFATPGTDKLVKGQIYSLEIGAPDTDIWIKATDTIPHEIQITGKLALIAGAGTTSCLPKMSLNADFPVLIFRKKLDGIARSFELRVDLFYKENGTPKVVSYGPTKAFDKNFGCPASSGEICYEFGKYELFGFFEPKMNKGTGISLTYDNFTPCVDKNQIETISHAIKVEVTGMSSEFSRYKLANNPAFTDLSGSKPEYTNMKGSTEAYGIFGSYVKDTKWALLDQCGEYLLSLNGTNKPNSNCEFP